MNMYKTNSTRQAKFACQEGSVLVIVMIILALLTVIGISATSMSSTELKIATNDVSYKKAFFHADSGVYGVSKWIHQVLDDEGFSAAGSDNDFDYLDEDSDGDDDLNQLWAEVMGYSAHDDDMDLAFTMATRSVEVDFEKRKPVLQHGSSGPSIGSGASSTGTSSIYELPYVISSVASKQHGASADITARYVKVDGIIGGL